MLQLLDFCVYTEDIRYIGKILEINSLEQI